jgi:4-hydroxy-3-polyprenylbenzoate decarboxylase
MAKRVIIGITGASGMIYARRLLEHSGGGDISLDVVISEAARRIIAHELGPPGEPTPPDSAAAMGYVPPVECRLHEPDALDASISSGSVMVDGMVVVPCSMNTLGRIACGLGDNLICRAAGNMLKEKRRLILVPRETPLSAIHLGNMLRLSRAGAVILPACPGFYHGPETIDDLVDSIVGRILDHLDIAHNLNVRWNGK